MMSVKVDLESITALFTKVVDAGATTAKHDISTATARRPATGASAEATKFSLLSHQRATNVGIAFAKLKVT